VGCGLWVVGWMDESVIAMTNSVYICIYVYMYIIFYVYIG
jgi:hypothetical protein